MGGIYLWMDELDDMSLLREYVERDSEAAFAALVARHVNKVYSVALRHTRSPHQAEEITQAVFVILAKKSRQLGKGTLLAGWLYQTARLAAVTFIRGEIRRAHREQEAYMQTGLNETETDSWPQIAPLLDTAMAGLSEADRHAVVLRFFDGKTMKEVGAALGASEDAAKMRVTRAVEKLRRFFTRRGVALSAAALTAAISAHSVQAAPTTLAKLATTAAITKGATSSVSTLTLIKGALKVMAWSKAKTAVVVGVVVLLTAGTTELTMKYSARQRLANLPRSTESAELFKQQCVERMNQGKLWGLAFFMYANDHQNEFPKDFDQAKIYNKASAADWEVVSSGRIDRVNTPRTILLREKEPKRDADGAYFRVYVLTDGSAQLTRSTDGDFAAVEKKWGWAATPARN